MTEQTPAAIAAEIMAMRKPIIRTLDGACDVVRSYVGGPAQIGYVKFDAIAKALLAAAKKGVRAGYDRDRRAMAGAV